MIYPVHLNSSKSIKNGRHYSLDMTVDNPSMGEIKNALKNNKISYNEEANRRHPKDLEVTGRFKVFDNDRKKVVQMVVENIKNSRNKKPEKIDNKLNLVPKKKKLKKKK